MEGYNTNILNYGRVKNGMNIFYKTLLNWTEHSLLKNDSRTAHMKASLTLWLKLLLVLEWKKNTSLIIFVGLQQ